MNKLSKRKCKNCLDVFQKKYPLDMFCSLSCAKEYQKNKTIVKPKKILPISEKRAVQLSEYRKLRDQYLKDNTMCEVHDCNKRSTNLHHRNGRSGNMLTNVEFFMACCETCHPQRIHENPEWARKNGYLI